MRPLDGGRLNAVHHPLRDLRGMSPSHGIYTDETWTQPEANHQGERHINNKLGGEGAPDDTYPPPPAGGQYPSNLKITDLKEALINIALDKLPDPTKFCQNPATHRYLHRMHTSI